MEAHPKPVVLARPLKPRICGDCQGLTARLQQVMYRSDGTPSRLGDGVQSRSEALCRRFEAVRT